MMFPTVFTIVLLLGTYADAFAPTSRSSTAISTSLNLLLRERGDPCAKKFNIEREDGEDGDTTFKFQTPWFETWEQKIETLLEGRIVAISTAFISLPLCVIGVEAQFFKKVALPFFPSSFEPFLAPFTWILALSPFFIFPFPIGIIPALVCIYFSIAGLPSLLEEESLGVTQPESEGSQGIVSNVAKLLEVFKPVILLPLALFEALISLLFPFWEETDNFFWNRLFNKEVETIAPEDYGITGNNFKNEKWIYINGISTSKNDAINHGKEMYEMFGRPVNVIWNPTNGIIVDLIECIAGKVGLLQYGKIKEEDTLREFLEESLREARKGKIEKVVLLSHSQGTIFTGKTIKALAKDAETELLMQKFLDVYIFAGCAHQMLGEDVRYLENISNRGDFVACIGHVCPAPIQKIWYNTQWENVVYSNATDVIEDGNWGHDLPSSYLAPMKAGKFSRSRLAKEYMNNGGRQK